MEHIENFVKHVTSEFDERTLNEKEKKKHLPSHSSFEKNQLGIN